MKQFTPFSQMKLNQSIHILEDFVAMGKSVAVRLPTEDLQEALFIRVNLFGRYVNRIEVVIQLMKQWEKNPEFEDSIGIIIRACLADVLSQFYLEDCHSQVDNSPSPSPEEKKYLESARDLLADHLFSGVNYYKSLKDGGVYSDEDYRNNINKWKEL